MRYDIDYEITVCGIPAGVVIDYYRPTKPFKQFTFPGAGPGDCLPPEEEELEIILTDRKGYPAEWLERKANMEEIKEKVLAMMKEEE